MVNRREVLKAMAITPISLRTRSFSRVEPLTTPGRLLIEDLKPYVSAGIIKKVYFAGKVPAKVSFENNQLYFALGYRVGSTIDIAFERLTGKMLFLSPFSIYKATIIANDKIARIVVEEQNTFLISGIGFGMSGALLAYLYMKWKK